MMTIPSLLQAFVVTQSFFLTVDSAPMPCFEAHMELYDNEISVCRTASLTTEEKLIGQCDPECQSLLSSVVENCQVGAVVDEVLSKVVPYQPGFLYHEFHQNQFTSTWSSCDFGYHPPLATLLMEIFISREAPYGFLINH